MFEETYTDRGNVAHCADCGKKPAFRPRVHVANFETGTRDQYLLDIPHMCDDCVAKRGFRRHNILVPRGECQNLSEACGAFIGKLPDWIKKVQQQQLKQLIDQGMPEHDARDMLGVV